MERTGGVAAMICELHGFALERGYGPCGGGMDRHHIISRQLMRGCKAARKFVDKY